MAKKNILNGVSSKDLVSNLNAQYLGGYNSENLIGKILQDVSTGGMTIKLDILIENNTYCVVDIKGIAYSKSLPVNSKICFYWLGDSRFVGCGCIHEGVDLGKVLLYVKDSTICVHIPNTNNKNIRVYVTGRTNAKLVAVSSVIRETFSSEGVSSLTEVTPTIGVRNKSGLSLDVVDLPNTVSTLDIDTLPPIANVGTIILRYNGVVQDLDNYVSQVEEPVMPLPLNDAVEVSADMPATLELNSEIAPLVNLDEYIGTPNNWLKIYVPNNVLSDYIIHYPSLVNYLYPINGNGYKEIGGRNLILNSNESISNSNYRVASYKFINSDIFKDDDDFVFTLKGKLGDNKTHFSIFNTLGLGQYGYNLKYFGDGIYRCSGKWKISASGNKNLDIYTMPGENISESSIEWAKLEKGTVATDWTPALEDIDAQFDEVYDTIQKEKEYTEETYAKKDGAYEGLLAGTALNLQGQQDITISSMYQPTGGNLDVNWETAEILNIKGNAVVWNQLVKNGNFTDKSNWKSYYCDFSVSNNEVAITAFDTGFPCIKQDINSIANHVYLVSFAVKGGSRTAYFNLSCTIGIGYNNYELAPENTFKTFRQIIKETENKISYICLNNRDSITDIIYYKNVQLFDLTLIYGIGNEPTTLEQFEEDYRRWFGKNLEYEEYDDGSIRNTKATGIKTIGFNLSPINEFEGAFNDIYENILFDNRPLNYLGNVCVQFDVENIDEGAIGRLNMYFNNNNQQSHVIDHIGHYSLISNNKNSTQKLTYIVWGFSKNGKVVIKNICVDFIWSGTRDGDYEEHWEETKSLPLTTLTGKLNGEGKSVVVFPDGMKRAGNAYDEIYVENGITKAIKRIGSVDLGTLVWIKRDSNGSRYNANFTAKPILNMNGINKNGLSDRYIIRNFNSTIPKLICMNGGMYTYGGQPEIVIRDIDFEDTDNKIYTEEEFTNSLQGSIFYYELAEPEVYILDDEFQLPLVYKIDDFGTEQIISPENTITPILTTRYGVNAVDTLRRLPQNYISERSINNLLYQLNSVMNGTWNKSWNSTTNSYDFSFVPNEVPDSSLPNEELP